MSTTDIALREELPTLPPGVFTGLGFNLPEDLSVDDWRSIGEALSLAERGVQWAIGDWWSAGEHRYGEAAQIAFEIGIDAETLRGHAWVAANVTPELRKPDLSWSHHRAIAALCVEDQVDLLDKAADEKWSVRRLTEAAREAVGDEKPRKAPEPVRHAERRDEAVFSVTQAANRLSDAAAVVQSPGFRLGTDVAQDLLREVGKVDTARATLLGLIDDEVGALGMTVPKYDLPKQIIDTRVATAGNVHLAVGNQKVSLGGLSDEIGEQTITFEEYMERTR